MALNISSNGAYPANVLSNFAATPFIFDGVHCASAEGFIQALKFKDPEMQKYVCSLVGLAAKRKGRSGNKRVQREQKVWWLGQDFIFRSDEHFNLVQRALTEKFLQSNRAKKALLSTVGMTLEHYTGHPESPHTSLPARNFIRILCLIRDSLEEQCKGVNY